MRVLSVILLAVFVASVTYADNGVLGRESVAPTAAGASDSRLVPLGDGFLAIWTSGQRCSPELRGMRLDRDGRPLDTTSFVVAPSTYAIFIIAAVSDGDDVDVAWSGVYDPIHLTRVTADTVTVLSDSVPIPTGSGSGIRPVMTVSNGNILFVGVEGQVVATLLDRSGTVVRSRVALLQQTQLQLVLGMDLAAVNGGFLLAWLSTDGHPRAARITPAELLATDVLVTQYDLGARDRYMYNIRLASDGERAMVLWTDAVGDGSHYKFRARPLSSFGTPLGAATVTIDFVTPSSSPPQMLAVPDGYEVFFTEVGNYRPSFVHLSFDGTLKAAAHPPHAVAAAQNGNRTIATWTEKLFSMSTYFAAAAGYEALTAPITPDGIVGDGTIISIDPSVQHVRKLVQVAGGVVALWTEGAPNDRLAVTRLTASGQPMDGGLQLRESLFDQSHSAMATDGDRLFVVWTEGDESKPQTLYGAIVSAGGALSATVKVLANDASDASDIGVVWNGESFAIAYRRIRTGGFDFAALRVDRSGNVIDPVPIALTPTRIRDDNPRLSWNGTDYLLVWQRRYNPFVSIGESCDPPQPPLPAELFAQRFNTAFALTGAEIALATTTNKGDYWLDVENVDVSFVGGRWLVVWLDKGSLGPYRVSFARIDANGVRLEPLNGRWLTVTGEFDDPVLALASDGWLIAAHEGRRLGPGRGVALGHIGVDGTISIIETVPISGTTEVEGFVLTPAPLVAFKRASSAAAFTGTLPRSRAVHR